MVVRGLYGAETGDSVMIAYENSCTAQMMQRLREGRPTSQDMVEVRHLQAENARLWQEVQKLRDELEQQETT